MEEQVGDEVMNPFLQSLLFVSTLKVLFHISSRLTRPLLPYFQHPVFEGLEPDAARDGADDGGQAVASRRHHREAQREAEAAGDRSREQGDRAQGDGRPVEEVGLAPPAIGQEKVKIQKQK